MERLDESQWVRLAALAGVVFFILIVVQGPILHGSSPSMTDSARTVFNYVTTHQGRIKASALLYGLAMSAVLIWVSVLFRALRRAEGRNSTWAVAALAGTVLAAAMSLTAAATEAATALRAQDLTPLGTRLFWTLYQFSQAGILFGLAVLVGSTAVVCLRTGLADPWFAEASVLLSVLSLVGASGMAYATGAIQTIAAIMLSLDTLWVLVVSIFLFRNPELVIERPGSHASASGPGVP